MCVCVVLGIAFYKMCQCVKLSLYSSFCVPLVLKYVAESCCVFVRMYCRHIYIYVHNLSKREKKAEQIIKCVYNCVDLEQALFA